VGLGLAATLVALPAAAQRGGAGAGAGRPFQNSAAAAARQYAAAARARAAQAGRKFFGRKLRRRMDRRSNGANAANARAREPGRSTATNRRSVQERLHQMRSGRPQRRMSRRERRGRRQVPAPPHALAQLRQRLSLARGRAKRGEIERAAAHLGRLDARAMGRTSAREFARTERKIRKAGVRAAIDRSRAGDPVGTQDALVGLDALRGRGSLGAYGRARTAIAKRRAVNRLLDRAERPRRVQDLTTAEQQLEVAAQHRGRNHRSIRSARKALYNRSMRLARKAANKGEMQNVETALVTAGRLAPQVGAKRFAKKAERYLKTAAEKAVPELITTAQKQFKERDYEQAAQTLFFAMTLQEKGKLQYSWYSRTERIQRKLKRRLAPRLDQLRREGQAQEAMGGQAARGPRPSWGTTQESAVEMVTGGAVQ
jgi:hypothetical protein